MKLIPVVDLMQGQVVHARMGERHNYRPIQSLICPSSEPEKVIESLQALYRFDTLYIADLDAIQGKKRQSALLAKLQQRFADLKIYLDAGFNDVAQIQEYPRQIIPVIGSESIHSLAQWQKLATSLANCYVLSLDFKGDQFLGCEAILQQAARWPNDLIVMCLAHVGSQLGPDFARLASCLKLKPLANWIAAGGVRHQQDLIQLESLGFSSALLASALHQKQI